MNGLWNVSRVGGQVRVAYGRGADYPQYAALHLRDSYLRLNYGPGAGWGTSVILLPVYWCGGVCFHGAPVDATWSVEGSDLVLGVSGRIGALDVRLRVRLEPPTPGGLIAHVEGEARGDTRLDERPREAFKPVMLSSMRISPTLWDAECALVGGRREAIPPSGWVGAHPLPAASTLGLRGGTSAWKANATTITLEMDRAYSVAGWVTPSADPNDDNVGLWPAADVVLPRWRYSILASP